MRESSLRWFDHVYRKVTNIPKRNSELIYVKGTKKDRGSQKITLVEVIKNMSINELIEMRLWL